MKNLGWDVKLVCKPKKGKVLRELYEGYTYDIIHLATHGDRDSIEAGRGRRGWITVDEIADYFGQKLTNKDIHLDNTLVVVNTGCKTGSDKWANLFIKKLRAKYYIAPRSSLVIEDGILFPLVFYMRLRVRKSVKPAFNHACLYFKSSGNCDIWKRK